MILQQEQTNIRENWG